MARVAVARLGRNTSTGQVEVRLTLKRSYEPKNLQGCQSQNLDCPALVNFTHPSHNPSNRNPGREGVSLIPNSTGERIVPKYTRTVPNHHNFCLLCPLAADALNCISAMARLTTAAHNILRRSLAKPLRQSPDWYCSLSCEKTTSTSSHPCGWSAGAYPVHTK